MATAKIKEGDWIRITKNNIPAYVINIIDNENITIGYYQNNSKAIKEDCILKDGIWEFRYSGPSGSYIQGSLEYIIKSGPN